jgi:hypothetical protein
MNWILVLHVYAGMFSDTDSVSIAAVAAFPTKAECQSAGAESQRLVDGTKKELKYVCLAKKNTWLNVTPKERT